jgi:Sec-independent protein translocase protein TatA
VGKAVKGFKDATEDLRKSVEPELNILQQEMKMVEQDFQASIQETEEEINSAAKHAEGKSTNHTAQA